MSLCKSCQQADKTCPVYPQNEKNLCVEYAAIKPEGVVYLSKKKQADALPALSYKLIDGHFINVFSEQIKALKVMVPAYETKILAKLTVIDVVLTDIINTDNNIDLDEPDFPALLSQQAS